MKPKGSYFSYPGPGVGNFIPSNLQADMTAESKEEWSRHLIAGVGCYFHLTKDGGAG